MKKLHLIATRVNSKPNYSEGAVPPLGILAIASYAKQHRDDLEIKIDDCAFFEVDRIKREIENYDADFIGFSSTALDYCNAFKLAKYIKENWPLKKTILGGPYATFLQNDNIKYFDYIVKGAGEKSLLSILEEPNEKIISEPISPYEFSILNYGLLGVLIDNYSDNYIKQILVPEGTEDVKAIYTHKGCNWRNKIGGCLFCSISKIKEVEYRTPKSLWEEISIYKKQFGTNFIHDVGEDITSDTEWLEVFVAKRPKGLGDIRFSVYARANGINKRMIELFSKLGISQVHLGIESGSNKMLRKLIKGTTREQNEKAINLLTDAKIRTYSSFVLGAPFENRGTLEKTYSLIEKIVELGQTDFINAYILTPLPGSKAFEMLAEKYPKIKKEIPNSTKLQRLWIKEFTDIDYFYLKEFIEKISAFSKIKSKAFSWEFREDE